LRDGAHVLGCCQLPIFAPPPPSGTACPGDANGRSRSLRARTLTNSDTIVTGAIVARCSQESFRVICSVPLQGWPACSRDEQQVVHSRPNGCQVVVQICDSHMMHAVAPPEAVLKCDRSKIISGTAAVNVTDSGKHSNPNIKWYCNKHALSHRHHHHQHQGVDRHHRHWPSSSDIK